MKPFSAPQRDSSPTKSAKSGTSRVDLGIETPVQYVKGVGPRLGAIFESRGISTVRDLLWFLPRAYEDRTRVLTISELKEGEPATVDAVVMMARKVRLRGRKSLLECRVQEVAPDSDLPKPGGATIGLKWFHAPHGLLEALPVGKRVRITGTPKKYLGHLSLMHPEISRNLETQTVNTDRVVPVYVEIEGIPNRTFRKVLWNALEQFGSKIPEELPAALREKYQFPVASLALREMHYPTERKIEEIQRFRTPAQRRWIFEEFFRFQLAILRGRAQPRSSSSLSAERARAHAESLVAKLPFTLTRAQVATLDDTLRDLTGSGRPMNRLIQGDVGSGKTVIALLAAGILQAEGFQSALMVPTEILAEQHLRSAEKLFGGALRVALLTGSTTATARAALATRLENGEPLLVIGTHALIEDTVRFSKFALAMIDEQHRFGVEQRAALKRKGRDAHLLVLTATPIPRTLALTFYGDLDTSIMRERPPGRTPIQTFVVKPHQVARAIARTREEVLKGRQAYIIFPLVDEAEPDSGLDLKSAIQEAERLKAEVFPEFSLGLLHGRMSAAEKDALMTEFRAGRIQILVSTTVIEVGVDVPNATVMMIEHAERFGLAQLHQLRGRVGRGSHASVCLLVPSAHTAEQGLERLAVMEATEDGFEIAEADLRVRGPGEFLGHRQSGSLPFKVADLIRDSEILDLARSEAVALLAQDADLSRPEHRGLARAHTRDRAVLA